MVVSRTAYKSPFNRFKSPSLQTDFLALVSRTNKHAALDPTDLEPMKIVHT